jgi:hypothetical protein
VTELPDYPRQGSDCPPVKIPKAHLLENVLIWAESTTADYPRGIGGLSGDTHLTNNNERWTIRGLHRIVCRSVSRKQTETNRFWTLLSCERRTVRLTTADCPQFKNSETHRREGVLDTLQRTTADCPCFGTGLSTGQKTENKRRNNNSELTKTRCADCPRVEQQTVRESRRTKNRAPPKSPLTSISRFAPKFSPTATKLGEHDHKTVG